jgi:hypothetical protein
MVKEASAILVAIIHLRDPGGAGSKILVYISEGKAE